MKVEHPKSLIKNTFGKEETIKFYLEILILWKMKTRHFEYIEQKLLSKITFHNMITTNFSVGDIFYKRLDSKFTIFKILDYDNQMLFENENLIEIETFHVLQYSPIEQLPTIEEINNLEVAVYHSIMNRDVYVDTTLLFNTPVKPEDVVAYHKYLKQYQALDMYISKVRNYYNNGIKLRTENRIYDAIDSYSMAIDLMPDYYKAIDNRAFCKMDLGLWYDAIQDFRLSLIEKPNNFIAEFSIGECYYKLGDYNNAKEQFLLAKNIDEHHEGIKFFLDKIDNRLDKQN